MSRAKTDEPIEIPFGGVDSWGGKQPRFWYGSESYGRYAANITFILITTIILSLLLLFHACAALYLTLPY